MIRNVFLSLALLASTQALSGIGEVPMDEGSSGSSSCICQYDEKGWFTLTEVGDVIRQPSAAACDYYARTATECKL